MATLGELMLPTTTLGQLIGASAPGTTNVPQVTPATPPPAAPTLASYMKQPKDWQKILGIIGDALQTAGGGRGSFVPMLQAQREKAAEQQQAYDLAERKFEYDKQLEALKDHRPAIQQNLDWFKSLGPEDRQAFSQLQDLTNPLIETTWQGPVTVPRGSQQSQAPTRPVGKLTPIEPTITNTPAPTLGANGAPAMLTRQQYQAVVNSMGQAATDAWMARNGIKVGGM